jgi:flavoprotein
MSTKKLLFIPKKCVPEDLEQPIDTNKGCLGMALYNCTGVNCRECVFSKAVWEMLEYDLSKVDIRMQPYNLVTLEAQNEE